MYVLLSPWRLPPGLSVEYFIKVGSPQSAEISVQIVYHERKQWKKKQPTMITQGHNCRFNASLSRWGEGVK